MSDLLDLHHISTDTDYAVALDELEQLRDLADPDHSERAQELAGLVAEYEHRVTRTLADAMRNRGLH